MFTTKAIYKGEWSEDLPHGQGILFSGDNEIIEGKFEKGMVAYNNKRVKILFQDGQYYEGAYSNNKRHGFGTNIYPNGDKYEGDWMADKRVGRGKIRQTNGIRI